MSFLEPSMLAAQAERLGPSTGPTPSERPRRPVGWATVASTLAVATVLGGVMALAPGDERRLSIDLWLIGMTVFATLGLTRQSLATAPTARPRLRPMIGLSKRPAPEEAIAPRAVVTLEGGLVAATGNPRSYHYRIRPRLRAVAANRLRADRGIDLDREPERAAEVIGDLAWLIDGDPDRDDRAPTVDDINRLLDLVGSEYDRNR